ncbi:MAG TPA: polyhydroxyalkanoate depolymerase [Beijerinckiaceae bacterium]|jgi:poly(3-hydroxybutyrate) depolymerase|nr:polyhydroxyalkanoate depolymerase [Beijerinckiaceae bacterium]
MNRLSYQLYEMAHLSFAPARFVSDATRLAFKNPLNPLAHTYLGRNIAASAELFERLTRRYGKPAFGLDTTVVEGKTVPVREEIVWERPYCGLIHFERQGNIPKAARARLLIVAPMSGHYATLLRGTVEAFLPDFDVYITDWADGRMVPMSAGRFDLDDYIDYVTAIFKHLHEADPHTPVHVLAVCQPAVPVVVSVALLEAAGKPYYPDSMILMGGPIDTRRSPTAVNTLAEQRGTDWFRRNCIHTVPFPYPGFGREVYPGFLQLTGFMAMNFDRHFNAHVEMFRNLVKGDGDTYEKQEEFYDEYMAVMDLDAAYYLQTVETVFVRHDLPKGEMKHRGQLVDLKAIKRVALMTVEGENDDISGVGQTQATHALCPNIPEDRKLHHLQEHVGHYGVFNGSRFRRDIAPRIKTFTRAMERWNKSS